MGVIGIGGRYERPGVGDDHRSNSAWRNSFAR
jgi:hypothetical protein